VNAGEVSECLELIDKLQKEKKGNPNDLDNYKQLLVENKNLHKSNVNYLKSLDGQIPTKQTPKQKSELESVESMSADQLRELTKLLHDEYKEQWDKDGVVQLKTDRMAILQRMWGKQVQFCVACDQLTKEGYRLMAIDEGQEAGGVTWSAGINAYFYFQKMKYIK